MRQLICQWAFFGLGLIGASGLLTGCDDYSALEGKGDLSKDPSAAGDDKGDDDQADDDGDDDGGPSGDDAGDDDDIPDCPYDKGDQAICECLKYNCGATTVEDKNHVYHAIFCGGCEEGKYCVPDGDGAGVGTCGGTNPLAHKWQREKTDMLVSIGENDNTTIQYGFAKDINDGRGYTIGKVGFCTGTGDFIWVAACYNARKPGNVLEKYWGTRDAKGVAQDGLIYYNDLFMEDAKNQKDHSKIDSLGKFTEDVAKAAEDEEFKSCQDDVADALYLSTAIDHVTKRGLKGALTVAYLYDLELNFGDEDDPDGTVGARTVMANADKAYGTGLPTDFADKPWEESKWLGLLIQERTKVMAADPTWEDAIDQNATWEAARRLHTGKSGSAASATDLSMDYDFISKYKAGNKDTVAPCWTTGLKTTKDTQAGIFTVSTDKSASATDQSKWRGKGVSGGGAAAACPANPTQ